MLQSIKQGLLVCMLLLCLVGDLSSKPSFDNGSSPVSQSEENVDVRNALILEFHLNIDCITIHDVHNFTERLLVDEKEEDEKHHKSVNKVFHLIADLNHLDIIFNFNKRSNPFYIYSNYRSSCLYLPLQVFKI